MAAALLKNRALVLFQSHHFFPSSPIARFLRLVHTLLLEEEDMDELRAGHGASLSDGSQQKDSFRAHPSRALDSVALGVKREMISEPVWAVLNHLKKNGHSAYLVGGCVRDLLLHRTPKDFDVVTTAGLKQIMKQCRRSRIQCSIVGSRFPICHITIKKTRVEVSSFQTENTCVKETDDTCVKKTDDNLLSQRQRNYDEINFLLRRSSMRRDFTVNSLLYNPFLEKVYDYAGGLRDLKLFKLRTIIPAHFSFKEDSARMLRGLRFASRLGMSFSKDAEAAICDLASSISNLGKSRVMLEMNYIFAYGAAEPAMVLLKKFKLLDILLPIQAAYLSQQGKNLATQGSTMLLKLLHNMDKLLGTDRPTSQNLWIALLAFHLALINRPQKAYIIWVFSSVLYYGNWAKAVDSVGNNPPMLHKFIPEILRDPEATSNQSLDEDVSQFASLVNDSVKMLACHQLSSECLPTYLSSGCTQLLNISPNAAKNVSALFNDLATNIQCYSVERDKQEINYKLLANGDREETKFVLGRIIMDTMRCQNLPKLEQDSFMDKESAKLLSALF